MPHDATTIPTRPAKRAPAPAGENDTNKAATRDAQAARARRLLTATRQLARDVAELRFAAPVTHVYNPLAYAWAPHRDYVRAFAGGRKRVIFLGMNPGPWGMSQTGVPFGEITHVKEFLQISGAVGRPAREHPKRPVLGFACARSEVSGRRLWGAIAARFGDAPSFFEDHYIANYCPLAFLEESGRNRTPDKLPAAERDPLFAACDRHLEQLVRLLEPEWIIGVGAFAEKRARAALPSASVKFGRILHPSPANPTANRDWSGTVARQLAALGIWDLPPPSDAAPVSTGPAAKKTTAKKTTAKKTTAKKTTAKKTTAKKTPAKKTTAKKTTAKKTTAKKTTAKKTTAKKTTAKKTTAKKTTAKRTTAKKR